MTLHPSLCQDFRWAHANGNAETERLRTLVIGVGNEYRCDDGVGLFVARQFRTGGLSNVEIIEASGEGATLMEAWSSADFVILIDAVFSGAAPGTVHYLDARNQPIPASFFHYSTHAFSVAEAIELARVFDHLPSCFTLYGIEGKTFEMGTGLSPEVENAAAAVMEQVLQDICQRRIEIQSHA